MEVTHKRCNTCDEYKPLDDFPPRKESRDGRRHICRKCKGKQDTNTYQPPPDEMAPVWREWNGAAQVLGRSW